MEVTAHMEPTTTQTRRGTRTMTFCSHVFQRGEQKGKVCNRPLRIEKSKVSGLCGKHQVELKEKIADSSKNYNEGHKEFMYEVTMDNADHKYLKKAPATVITRVVAETRAKHLKKLGATIKRIEVDIESSDDDVKTAKKAAFKQYQLACKKDQVVK